MSSTTAPPTTAPPATAPPATAPPASRVQLALNVSDLNAAIEFYSSLFDTRPDKVRDGYANFAISEPPLKLVLMEGGEPGTLNHLGVEVPSTDEVAAATSRLSGSGLDTAVEDEVTCCFAVQDKVWVHGPDDEAWEVYTVLADSEVRDDTGQAGPTACCS